MKRTGSLVAAVTVLVLFVTLVALAEDFFTVQARRKLIVTGSTYEVPQTVAGTAGALTLPSYGTTFLITGTAKQTSIVTSAAQAGRRVTLIMSSTDTVVAGSNLKIVADFNGTTNDALILISDGTNWIELGRNVNAN